MIACPFCGKAHTSTAWAAPDFDNGLEPFECLCGAWWYEGMPDEETADVEDQDTGSEL